MKKVLDIQACNEAEGDINLSNFFIHCTT